MKDLSVNMVTYTRYRFPGFLFLSTMTGMDIKYITSISRVCGKRKHIETLCKKSVSGVEMSYSRHHSFFIIIHDVIWLFSEF